MVEKDVKKELALRTQVKADSDVRITASMGIGDIIRAMEPEIRKALPSVMTPERFTRIALSAANTTPKLAECTPVTFLTALMNAAQLGLEPNTPLGQAYLIPYKNKGRLECQFQIGYKGLLDLAYRNPLLQTVQAQTVYENDVFEFELGLNAKLFHKPTMEIRGKVRCFYALYKLQNGGFGFEVMSKEDVDDYARRYSRGLGSDYSPWTTNYDAMAKKTVIKQLLKFAPLRTDIQKALSMDESIKMDFSVDMSEVQNEEYESAPDGAKTAAYRKGGEDEF